MRLVASHKALAGRIGTIPKLTALWFPTGRIVPPMFCMGLPNRIEFDGTMARGMDTYELYGYLFVSNADMETALVALGEYCDGSGDRSIKEVVEGATYPGVFDSVRVADIEFDYEPVADDKFLAAQFTFKVNGRGAD